MCRSQEERPRQEVNRSSLYIGYTIRNCVSLTLLALQSTQDEVKLTAQTNRSLALDLVNLVLSECEVSLSTDYENISIASTVLYHLSCIGLLFIVLYKLNSMLRSRLGSVVTPVRVILLTIFAIMTVVYIVYIALSSWLSSSGMYYYRDGADSLVDTSRKLSLAVRCLYLICVLVSTGLAITTISSLRRAHIPGGVSFPLSPPLSKPPFLMTNPLLQDLLGWVITLHLFMLIWTVLAVVLLTLSIYSTYGISVLSSFILAYVLTFFQAMSFIAILPIAKHVCWGQDAGAMHHHYSQQPVQTPYAYGDTEYIGHAK